MKLTGGGRGEEDRRVDEKKGEGSRRADAEVSREGEGGGTHFVLRIRVCPLGQQQRGSLGVTIATGPVQWGLAVLREREGRGA